MSEYRFPSGLGIVFNLNSVYFQEPVPYERDQGPMIYWSNRNRIGPGAIPESEDERLFKFDDASVGYMIYDRYEDRWPALFQFYTNLQELEFREPDRAEVSGFLDMCLEIAIDDIHFPATFAEYCERAMKELITHHHQEGQ